MSALRRVATSVASSLRPVARRTFASATAGAPDDSAAIPNEACVLARRPGVGNPVSLEDMAYEPAPALTAPASAGGVVLATQYLSVDPYMRCMFDKAHPQLGDYQQPYEVGAPLHGGGVGKVLASDDPNYEPGDLMVVPFLGYPWQRVAELNPAAAPEMRAFRLRLGDPDSTARLLREHPSLALGALGMVGATAYAGMFCVGQPERKDTVVVSGAAGGVGSLAGQLAVRQARCHLVVGICGTEEKCEALRGWGFDEALNYNDPDFATKLLDACPNGVDVYFDNVGGDVSDSVLRLMNIGGRVPICGQISMYDDDVAYDALCGDEGVPADVAELLQRRGVKRGRFTVINYAHVFEEASQRIAQYLRDGTLQAPETMTDGFHPAEAFVSMMQGANLGKAIVRV